MKTLLSLIVTLSVSLGLYAQNGILSGRIVDDSKLPLAGATIIIDDVRATVSDEDGNYALLKLESGTYTVTVYYIGYEDASQQVTITSGQTTVVDFEMTPGVTLQQVNVTSQLRGQSRALSNQLSNYNITNIIAADQIGRFPDANIGDALKRIPGINVQYDQGEARFGNIRGTAPQLNSITINGERIPSAEAEIRSIQLDLIPSDMIQAVEVSKAVTPDMDADAIGGSVNLVTRAAPYERRISGTLGVGYNLLANKPTYNGSIIYGDRFAKDKLGIIFSASYFDNNLGSDNVEAEWTYDDVNGNDVFDEGEDFWPEEIQIRQYYLQRTRQSYSLSLDYKANKNHTLFVKGIYNRRKDYENRFRAVYKDIEVDSTGQWMAEIERETKAGTNDIKYARLEDQVMMNFSLGGNHLFGKLRTDWSVNYSKASEDRPNERYYEITTDDLVPIDLDFSNPETPLISAVGMNYQNPSSDWELSAITEEFQNTEDEDMNARLDFILPLDEGKNQNHIKFGGRLRSKAKFRDNDFYEYDPLDASVFNSSITMLEDYSKSNFLPGNYTIGSFTTKEFVGDLDLTNTTLFDSEQDLSELAGNFTASEQIIAGYALLQQQLGPKFLFVVGLRLEQTDLEYSGFQYDDDSGTLTETAKSTSDYMNILPGLHIKYLLKPKTVLRFAYTNTLARPNYFDLVPYREIEDGVDLSIGNPSLGATTSTNFDLMLEHYFGTVGIVSGGVFYKDISDFIVNQTNDNYLFEGTTWDSYTQPINGGNATLIGVEVAFQRQLDFIAPALKGVGIYFNYTFTESNITDFNIEGRENEDLPLPGSPKHTLNTSLSYEVKQFTSRISFNYASDFIDEVGEEAFGDIHYDQVTYLDFNCSYKIPKRNLVIYANANNLLNQPLRYYQGVMNRTYQMEYYNVKFDLGLKFDLGKK